MKPNQMSRSNKLLGERPNPQPQCNREVPTVITTKCAIIVSQEKGKPYHHEWSMEFRNTEILQFIPLILHHFTHKKYARMKYYTGVGDDCNLAHTEINICITS